MKKRLDLAVVEEFSIESREKARALIMAGVVFVNGQKADKAGSFVADGDRVELKEQKLKFVSRGGQKLEKALDEFAIDLKGKVALDAGASTGGFTDCMLQRGAKRVYAVDVGYGQLAWTLRNDERVINMERTNVRLLSPEDLPEPCDFATADLAFISLRLVLGPICDILKPGGEMVCLIKPQFEAGREQVGKNGVVRDPNVHVSVIREVCGFARSIGFSLFGLSFSPVKGPKGNIEYLAYIKKSDGPGEVFDYETVVSGAHTALKGGDGE